MDTNSEEKIIDQKKKRPLFGRLLRFLAVILLLVFLLTILAGLVVQDEDFQNWAVKKVTTDLSERLDTKVELERIDLDFFNNLSFSKFYVQDYNQDTLIYSDQLNVDLNMDWRTLLNGRVLINEISLNKGIVKLRRDSGQFYNNIQLLAEKLKTETDLDKDKNSGNFNSFELDLDHMSFKDVCFVQNDKLRGQDLKACLENAKVQFEDFTINENLYNIEDVHINGLTLDLHEYNRNESLFDEFFVKEGAEKDALRSELDSLAKPLVFTVQDIIVSESSINIRNTRNASLDTLKKSRNVLDFKDLAISDLNFEFNNLNFNKGEVSGRLKDMSLKEKSGFEIDGFEIVELLLTDRKIETKNYQLKTPNSLFGGSLSLKYRDTKDFEQFVDKVYINSEFNEAKIGIKDVLYLGDKLAKNEFLNLYRDESIVIDGKLSGKVNNLKGSDLKIRLSDKLTFNGDFRSRNLTVKNEEFLNLEIDDINVAITSLRQLIPNFVLPPNFDKLGNLNFSGQFTGFFNDFVAFGDLQTDLGAVTSDVQLQLAGGVEKAKYTGQLDLKDFDLATWTGDQRFGNMTISANVKEGVGLKREVASANLNATLKEFTYKDYKYENIQLVGRLDNNEFDGDLIFGDENIDLDFGGRVSFAGDKPVYNFTSEIRNIDFQKLNLSEKNIVLSGGIDINVVGEKVSDIVGEVKLSDFNIAIKDEGLAYNLDTISLTSLVDASGEKNLHLESELLNLDLNGQYEVDKIAFAFQDYFVVKFPEYAERLNVELTGKEYKDVELEFDLEVFDSENLTYFLDNRIDTIRNMKTFGYFNTKTDSLSLLAELPSFTFDDNTFENINVLLEANENDTELVLGVLNTYLKQGQKIPAYSLLASASSDIVDFNFNINDALGEVYNLNVNGKLQVQEGKVFELSFLPSNLTLVGQEWDVKDNNSIRFGRDFLDIDNFVLTNGVQNVVVKNKGKKGINLSLEHFDLDEINKYTNYDKLYFDGDFTLDIEAKDVFALKDFELNLNMDSLKIFEDDWGVLSLNAKLPSLDDKVQTYLSLTKNDQQIIAEGYYIPPNKNRKNNQEYQDNFFDFDIGSNAVPLNLLEYFIPSGLSNTEGFVDADVKLSGFPTDINSEGELRIYDGAFDVDYLGTRYFVEDGIVKVTKTLLDGTGGIVKDKFGNEAVLNGGVWHTNLKDMVLDLVIDAPRFLALDTAKEDNELFYGIGLGKGTVKFTGPFNQTDIEINATTLDGTKMFIPIESDQESNEVGFINFVKREEAIVQEDFFELRGVNILLNLEITEAVDAQLIFDEEAGDIVKGKGRGNIEIRNTRTGEFSMYGNYEIEQGEYLFTYSYRDLVKFNKPFQVKRGGSIVWDGDPYTAQINLEAEYVGLRTSVFNLIAEFLESNANDGLATEARNTTNVDLSMFLKGDLFSPNIEFQMDFPELSGEIKGYVDSKMLTLSKDENELNRQVFGLMVIGSFLPSTEAVIGSDDFVNFGVNTVSQFLSNQLSLYVSELLSDILAENGVFTRAEFNVNYSVYDQGTTGIGAVNSNRASELSLQLKNYLFKERLAIKIGTDIGIGDETYFDGSTAALNTFDVIVEWVITKDRRFKLLVYNKNDVTFLGPQRQSGLGLNYRYEFDTWTEFFNGLKQKTKAAIKGKK